MSLSSLPTRVHHDGPRVVDPSAFDAELFVNPAFRRTVQCREGLERHHMEKLLRDERPEAKKPGLKRFSTQYGVDYGRSQGWRFIDRERWDGRPREEGGQRHHDLDLGLDAIFDDGVGRVGIQAAGRGERKAHYERFMDRGGPAVALRLGIRVIYQEYERGDKTPVLQEVWCERP